MSGAENVKRIVYVVSDNTLSALPQDARLHNIAAAHKSQHSSARMMVLKHRS